MPDNNVHSALVACGLEILLEKVVDNLKASVSAPSGFANAVAQTLGALSRLSALRVVSTAW